MKQKLLTRDEQRRRAAARTMASATVELQLAVLMRRALQGERDALVEFQQLVQYAPPLTRERLLRQLEAR